MKISGIEVSKLKVEDKTANQIIFGCITKKEDTKTDWQFTKKFRIG